MLFNRRVLTPVVVSLPSSSAPLSVLCVFLLLLLLSLLFRLNCRVVKNKAQGSELTNKASNLAYWTSLENVKNSINFGLLTIF